MVNIFKSKRKLKGCFKRCSIMNKGAEVIVAYERVRQSTGERTEIMPGSQINRIKQEMSREYEGL